MKNKVKIQFRRKRDGKIDYGKRLKLLKSAKPRLVIRKSLRYILLQIVEYKPEGDKIIVSYNSKSLEKSGWKHAKNNLPASYLAGAMLAKFSMEKKVNEAVLDLGLQTSVRGSKIYAAVKGAIDAGLKVPCRNEMFPDEARLTGKHIVEFAANAKEKSKIQFSKQKNISNMEKDFLLIKEKILKGN